MGIFYLSIFKITTVIPKKKLKMSEKIKQNLSLRIYLDVADNNMYLSFYWE